MMEKKRQFGIFGAVVCLIAMFIPTYIAIAAFCSGPKEAYKEQQHEIVSLSLTDTAGNSFRAEKNADADGLIAVFDGILANATKVSALSDSVRHTPAMSLSVKHADEKDEAMYRFYFNPKATSYFEDSVGQAYGIRDTDAAEFFRTQSAVCLFPSAATPVLRNAYDEPILPTGMTWSYLDHDGNYREVPTKLAEAATSVELDGAFTLNFDIAPDFVKATLKNGDNTVYDGALDQLASSISVTESTRYEMTVTAEWYEDASRTYKGSATYSFRADVYAQADFSLGENKVEAGQIAVINGMNIRDVSIISIKTEPELRYEGELITPVFCGNGETWSALLPIPATCFSDNAKTGATMTYQITVGYGAQTYSLNLDVTDRTSVTAKTGNAAKADIESKRSAANLSAASALLRDTAKTSAGSPLWGADSFYRYYEDGHYNFSLAFGKKWKLATGDLYTNTGVDFKMKAGTAIVATASGKIAAVGENDYFGKYVAVDHGMGLQSWYLHLGEVNAAVGAEVKRGQVIGKSGSTGFLPHNDVGFTLIYTVYGVPACSYAQSSKKGLEETGLNILAFH